MMHVWVIKTGGPVPYLPNEIGERLFRAGQFDAALRAAGHTSVWFSSQFEHKRKVQRDVPANQLWQPRPDAPQMVFLASCSYRRNISMARFISHWQLRRAFEAQTKTLAKPDVIFCAYPTLDLAAAAVAYGKVQGIPVVLDIRDLWPDVIYERLQATPVIGRFVPRNWLIPYERMARFAVQNAAAITGVATGMVTWAQERFDRPAAACLPDKGIYQSQPDIVLTDTQIIASRAFWADQGITLDSDVTRFVWAGSIVPTTDGTTLLAALPHIPKALHDKIEIVVCGTGSQAALFAVAAKTYPFLKVSGWVAHAHLTALLQNADVGLMCYLDRFDFQRSIPNKVVDYTAAGLRIVTGVQGEITRLTAGTDVVIPYAVGDAESLARALVASCRRGPARVPNAAAQTLFRTHFDAAQVLPRFVRYLEEIAVVVKSPKSP